MAMAVATIWDRLCVGLVYRQLNNGEAVWRFWASRPSMVDYRVAVAVGDVAGCAAMQAVLAWYGAEISSLHVFIWLDSALNFF